MNNSKNCWTVYCHTTPSGNRYIGITSRKPEKRWQNGRGYNPENPFGKAIEKYKWENIQHNIVSTDLTEKEAKWLENYLICYYWTFVGFKDCKGYNCTLGGEGVLGHVPTEETRSKQSEAMKGKQFSDEHKRKISESMKGKPSNHQSKTGKPAWNTGKHPSEETRRKQSESHKGKHLSEETRRKQSESHKGKYHTEESKMKMSESKKGKPSNRKDYHHSEETKMKMSESKKGKHRVIIDGKIHYVD